MPTLTDLEVEKKLCEIHDGLSRISYAIQLEEYLKWKIGEDIFNNIFEKKAESVVKKNTETLIQILSDIACEFNIPLPNMIKDLEWEKALEMDRKLLKIKAEEK